MRNGAVYPQSAEAKRLPRFVFLLRCLLPIAFSSAERVFGSTQLAQLHRLPARFFLPFPGGTPL